MQPFKVRPSSLPDGGTNVSLLDQRSVLLRHLAVGMYATNLMRGLALEIGLDILDDCFLQVPVMLSSWFRPYAWRCLRNDLSFLTGVALITWPVTLRAQSIDTYFPSGVGGYDQQLGVTVQSRARPLYAAPGIDVGSFNIRPRFDQSLLYNSDPTGVSGPGSWGSHSSASVSAGSLWSRDSLGMSLGIDNFRYFALPTLNHTDWNAGIGGGYTIGDNQLALAYSHQSYYQIGTGVGTVSAETPIIDQTGTIHYQPVTGIGTVRTETPILDQTDTAQLNYTFNLSRFSITPDLSASSYRFGTATVLGTPLNQKYLDRNALAGGVTTRYSMSDAGGLVVVVRAIDNTFVNSQPGVPSNDSKNYLLLAGADYQVKGVWRYRLLAGVELSTFTAPQYSSNFSPVVQGSVVWTPTGLITLTGTLTRSVQAPQSAGTNGFVLTGANLIVDYEYERNILFQGRGGLQYAQYLQSGAQTNLTLGGGISWLLNRKLRLSFDYDYSKQTGTTGFSTPQNPNTLTTGEFSQSLAALTLHVAF
jgi:hypothetical protein